MTDPYNIKRREDYDPNNDPFSADELYELWECSLRVSWIMKLILMEYINPKERSYSVVMLRYNLWSICALTFRTMAPDLANKKQLKSWAEGLLDDKDSLSYWKYLELTDEQRGAFKELFKEVLPTEWEYNK